MGWSAGLRDDPMVRDGIKALIGLTRISVRDHGAKGDGATDDKPAIQAAVAAIEVRGGGEIYFPFTGLPYQLASPVAWEADNCNIRFHFEPGASLRGDFAGALLQRTEGEPGPTGGVHEIVNGRFEQYHADGACVTAHRCVSFKATNCQFSGGAEGGIGIETFNSQCATLDACVFTGFTKIAIVAGNATMLLDCDVTGCVDGVRHQNLGLTVIGGRYEVNGRAIVLGITRDGSGLQSNGVKITGLSMESNGWGLHAAGVGGLTMDACAVSCNVAGNQGAIWLEDASNVLLAALSVSSGQPFVQPAMKIDNVKRAVFAGVQVNLASGVPWAVLNPVACKFIECPELEQISIKDGAFTMAGTDWPTIYCDSPDPITGYFRDDNYFNGVGGVPPAGSVYKFVRIGAGSVRLEKDLGFPLTVLHFPGGKQNLAGPYAVVFAEKLRAPNEWVIWGDLA
jgi:hypothetical protein